MLNNATRLNRMSLIHQPWIDVTDDHPILALTPESADAAPHRPGRRSPPYPTMKPHDLAVPVATASSTPTWLQPQFVFLALAATFGLAVLFANAPFLAADESDHFFRAFQLSQGTIIGEKLGDRSGGRLPALANKDMGNIPFHYENKMSRELFRRTLDPVFVDWSKLPRVFSPFPHTVVYAPPGYIPQVAAIVVGKFAHVGPLGLMYLARLAGFATCIWLGRSALRILPAYRWSCLVLLLCPMSLYLMGSVASDGVMIGCAWLMLALLLRMTGEKRPPATGELVVLLALACILATAKLVYLPLAGLVPLFVLPRLSRPRQRVIFGLAFILTSVLPVWVWSRVIASIFVPGRTDIPIDPIAQGHYMAAHPVGFLSLMANSIWVKADFIYRYFVGVLGWGDTLLPTWFYPVFGWGLLACVVAESSRVIDVRWSHRLFFAAAAAATVLMIYAAQYASWNSPGSQEVIDGIQGRYFLPVAPLVILGFPSLRKIRIPALAAPVLGTLLAATGAAVCLWAVIARFYIA